MILRETIKSNCKKYLPQGVYKKLYTVWIFLLYILTDKEKLKLIQFTSPVFKKVVIDDVSFDIRVNPENGSVDKEIYVYGAYEPDVLRSIRKYLRPDSVCVDIGGNIGQHSLYMSRVAEKGSVDVFEPLPRLVSQIQESIAKNNITNIHVHNMALSDTEGVMEMHINNLNIGMSTLMSRDDFSETESVQVKVFDDVWKDRGVVDFIKMDVEGYEYNVLKGMKKTLEAYHPVMLIEFSPALYKSMNIKSRDILEYLFNLGYRIYDNDSDNAEVLPQGIDVFLEKVTVQTNIVLTYAK